MNRPKINVNTIALAGLLFNSPAFAQPNVFVMVDLIQQGGDSAVQSSTAYAKSKGASYSDKSVSASSSKSASGSSELQQEGATYNSSSAAAARGRRGSAAARSRSSASSASSYRGSSASSAASASISKANEQYEEHDNASYSQVMYAQTGGDDGLPQSEALNAVSTSLIQTQVDVTYPEMILAEFYNGDMPTFSTVRKDPRFAELISSLARQNVGYILGATLTVRGTGGMVSNYGCQGSLVASLLTTDKKAPASNFSVVGTSKGKNLEDCQRNLAEQLSNALAARIRPKLGA